MTTMRRGTLIRALLTATTLAAGTVVYAQSAPPDAAQLPETKGTVKQYTLTPRGDIDGLILNDGTQVKLPAYLSTQVAFAVRPGDAVTVRGLKARALTLVDAVSVTNDATRAVVDIAGRRTDAAETTVQGRVAMALRGKRGEVNGALLDNGTQLRLPPPEAERLQATLQQGQAVAARGSTLTTPLGTVMTVRAIGASPDKLTELTMSPPRGAKGKGKGARDRDDDEK